ncbi:MAG: type II secretion system protein [Candidatus Hydrogenedentes bacterium]|nr:type II secretion system protein [Candidatus Hydrogenedentota bacterium]
MNNSSSQIAMMSRPHLSFVLCPLSFRSIRNPQSLPADASAKAGAIGFTLVELLVAIAIIMSVLAGVALVFTGAVRAVRTGQQSMDAQELARSVQNVMARDLSSAFTARDFGNLYEFFGTPIGMTFVGVVRARLASDTPNLARVTYVVHTSVGNVDFEDEDGNWFRTYALLRYVEPGISSLDSFPINWDQFVLNTNDFQDTFNIDFDEACGCNYDQYLQGFVSITPAQQKLVDAKKRELWIRMLAGDGTLPRAWNQFDQNGNLIKGFLDKFAEDYVLTERILGTPEFYAAVLRAKPGAPVGLLPIQPPEPPFPLFNAVGFRVDKLAFEPVQSTPQPFDQIDGRYLQDTDPSNGIDDNTDQLNKGFFSYGTVLDGAENVIMKAYWKSPQNSLDRVAPTAESFAGLGSPVTGKYPFLIRPTTNPVPQLVTLEWQPRIPSLVRVRFAFRLQSPYVGAPDMQRGFEKVIHVPSGYTRLDLAKQ